MSRASKTLARVLSGSADNNISFEDIRGLLRHLGFNERIRASHHIYSRDGVIEILNLQPTGGKAKAYQVRQVREVIVNYGLAGEPEVVDEPMDTTGFTEPTQHEAPSPGEEQGGTDPL